MNRILTWFPSVAPFIRRFASASLRERILIGIGAYLILALFLYYVVLDPSMGFRNEKLRAQVAASNGLNWMVANQAEARQRGGAEAPIRNESKLTVISSTADLHNVMIKRMQPGDDRFNVELSGQKYLSVIRWLISLETDHGLRLVDVRLEKTDEGIVDSRLTLR
ncbi:MAG: type II secretion system protein GspM [Gammaproteobacteria bacterium]|nr:type II secretion system protein GspM [Gammaproteobacteria bacterium]